MKMLRNFKLRGCGCNYLLIKNKLFRRIEPRELDIRYQCRLLASGKDGRPIDPCSTDPSRKTDSKGHTRPPNETAPPTADGCKITGTAVKPGTAAYMDQLPKPSVNCKWEEEQKKTAVKKNILLISGLVLFALSMIPLYKRIFPDVQKSPTKPRKSESKSVRKTKRPWVVNKSPSSSSGIPSSVPYLLIGSGTASFSAFRAIKSKDPTAKVLVIGNEPYYPYMRPPLSKEMFYVEDRSVAKKLKFKQWNGTERSLFYEPDDFYSSCHMLDKEEKGGVAVARGWTVKSIDATNRIAYLEDDKPISYEKCLIATGARPKTHPVFEDISEKELSDRVSLYRNIFDYEELEDIIETGAKSIVIIGGSFLGSELACALARRGKNEDLKVTQIFKESGNMGKILPEYLSRWTTEKVKKEGVHIVTNTTVVDVELKNNQVVLQLNSGKEVIADQVVLALGVLPNTDLAGPSNLEVDKDLGGFLVNAELEARSNLFVAGDCACFYDAKLGRRRVEHHDHAVVSGRLAGENMTGAGKPYYHQSMFWSDLGPDVGYEAIGVIDSSLPTVGVYAKVTNKDKPQSIPTGKESDGMRSTTEEKASESKLEDAESKKSDETGGELEGGQGNEDDVTGDEVPIESKSEEEDYGKGVIFYLKEGIVVGIVLWNVFNRMAIARQVLSDERKYEDLNEVAKLFNIHKD